jgi:hypothetical protein
VSLFQIKHKSQITRFNLLLIGLFCLAAFLRISLSLHQGLWVDEIFSLAMATGHSLEHPAAAADPTRGDYIEPKQAQSPSSFQQYMQHETPPSGATRVIRAVFLSDTNPPLYYLILNLWTRVTGSSDAALRLFSTLWALACFPLLWSLGLTIGGKKTAWAACVLFTFSPIGLYYSGEGRMFSLVWFLGVSLVWLTLKLPRRGSGLRLILTWTIVSAGGLLTHYFFAFVWVACSIWLWLHSEKFPRIYLTGMCILVGLLILPWYAQIPESLTQWRVTAGWLDSQFSWRQVLTAPFVLAYGLFEGKGIWGGPRYAGFFWAPWLAPLLMVLILRKRPWHLFTGRRQLLWFCGLAVILGIILFDLVMKTQTSSRIRYALPALPVALLLAGLFLSRLPWKAHIVFLLLIVLAWLPGIRKIYDMPSRRWNPFPDIAASLKAWAEPSDTVIIHSIPSGVLGVARYLDQYPRLASWVVQLEQRQQPESMIDLVSGQCRVALVKVHDLGKPSPAEAWLRQNANLNGEEKLHALTRILYFTMTASDNNRAEKGCE